MEQSNAAQPDLSVVIVSWNVRDLLVNCLDALFSPEVSGGLSVEVILVDNDSHDGSPQIVADYPAHLIANKSNLGYGRANNMGMKAATGRHLMILNPDTVVLAGGLHELLKFAEVHKRAGIVSPRLLNPDGSQQEAAFRFPTLLMALLDLFPPPTFVPGRLRRWLLRSELNGRYPDEAARQHPFKIDHPLGAAFLIRREAFEEHGGFDETIFIYSEEIDLALRYQDSGWECWQVPAARVIHVGGQSTKQAPTRMFVELWRSRLHVYKLYYSRSANGALRVLLALAMLKEMAATALARSGSAGNKRERMERAMAVLRLALVP